MTPFYTLMESDLRTPTPVQFLNIENTRFEQKLQDREHWVSEYRAIQPVRLELSCPIRLDHLTHNGLYIRAVYSTSSFIL
jgi:hypothetical protein